ncbi:dipeptidase [Allosphingosinicella indica]|uniref:Membrane dipeptidase n=1 Tax=Allosphingosinicella indica TaxID=941907 RepID=A0A1X7GAB9_9SPHN|nr:membrane dipeptidase [Allosphingosinicella indica]SMF66644.1 membrane dipeptidase [Allosphingosinicella indica]
MDRRDFLIGGAGAAALVSWPALAQTPTALAKPRPRGVRSTYIDACGAIDGFDEQPDGSFKASAALFEAAKARRIDAMTTTLGEVGNKPGAFMSAVQSIADYDNLIATSGAPILRVRRAADIEATRAAGRIGLIYQFQDTTALEGDVDNVQRFATLGVRILQLTYNKRNLAGDGCLEKTNGGVSHFGRAVIEKIEAADLLLDLSHAGQRTIAEGIAAARRPPAITHTGCRALADLPRNVPDAELKALADKGGVAGMYLMPFLRTSGQPGRDDLLRHLDHAVNVCGEDHVGIGTDNPLTGYVINDEMRKQQREFFQRRQKEGIAAPGEAADVLNLVDGYNDVSRFDRIAADLRTRGWSGARVDKVMGGNWLRLFREAWRG